MNKQEFITGLRQNLSGMEDYEFVNDKVNYYEDYIDTRLRKGEAESTILAELGEPRLIAKSIKASKSEITVTPGENVTKDNADYGDRLYKGLGFLSKLPAWGRKAVVGVAVVLLLIVAGYLLHFLFPVIVVAGVAYVFYRFFKDNFSK